MKGMMVHVLRDAGGVDCTAGGLSSRVTQALLIDGMNDSLGVFDAHEGDEVFVVRYRNNLPFIAVPGKIHRAAHGGLALTTPTEWVMFGGNYITTSDSRFSSAYGHVLPVHDRIER